jgi:hypothetical protein
MRPWHETSMHYLLCSGGSSAVCIKRASGHVTPDMCFCIWWDQRQVVHSGASGPCNVNPLFFMLGWDRCSFHEKHVGTHHVELVFL